MSGLGDDVDDIAVAHLVAQRHDAPIDLGADACVSHFSMDGVREVDAGGIAWQDDDLAFRSERVDLFGIEVDLQGGKKLVGIDDIALPFHHLS